MTTAYLATGDALAIVRSGSDDRWDVEMALVDRPTQCVASDPANPEIVYCGTFGQGLWRSEDGGKTWTSLGGEALPDDITAIGIGRNGAVWVGTEPSAIFRSDDGGETWREQRALRELPSAPTWSFPPRPWTSHVRWIAPDPTEPDWLYAGIELGGVMRSLDGGETWEDRRPDGLHDAHTLRTHPAAPRRVYEAAGGGYAQSEDAGASWTPWHAGLTRRYVWGLAVDPGDPDTVVVSASPGPREAHNPDAGEAAIYRRSGAGRWQEVREGLPDPHGTRAYLLAANADELGVFYAVTRDGDLYRSSDAGFDWRRQDVLWPESYRAPDVRGLVIV